MASTISSADGLSWTAGSAFVGWILNTIADRVADPALAARLREIDEFNLGGLDLGACSPAERGQILAVICTSLLPAAERELLSESLRPRQTINQLRELVKLFCGECPPPPPAALARVPRTPPAPEGSAVRVWLDHMITSVDELSWSAAPHLFYWVINTIANHVTDPALAVKVSEIDDYNAGHLDLRLFSPAERKQILLVIRTSLLPIAEREFPASSILRRSTINHLRALVKLLCT